MTELSSEVGNTRKELSEDAANLLKRCNWPGNIRELRNVIERAFYLAERSSTIMADHLPQSINSYPNTLGSDDQSTVADSLNAVSSIKEIKHVSDENERKFYIRMLMNHKGNISKTAQHLGISRTTLYNKLKEYRIQIGKFK
ncbi:helix-turn-helix domain-containing protein [Peribacillus sp. NPDC096379]|uniref:helix-turn-helix domain-containing protein n=1 Tax=Peribacillus sp. NPDC096379 TaxID=3364393 RepID=UPI00382F248F